MRTFQPAPCGFSASAAIAAVLVPLVAWAGNAQIARAEPDHVAFWTWFWLTAAALTGWAAAHLPKLAGWVDGTAAQRLEILQGIICSVFAGVVVYLLLRFWPGLLSLEKPPPEFAMIAVAGLAGFMGAHALEWLREKIFKRP